MHRELQIMPTYEVIVGNVGSVYHGKSRTKALATYESYVEISKEHDGARCYGEDVTCSSMARSSRSTRVICAMSDRRGAGMHPAPSPDTEREHHSV